MARGPPSSTVSAVDSIVVTTATSTTGRVQAPRVALYRSTSWVENTGPCGANVSPEPYITPPQSQEGEGQHPGAGVADGEVLPRRLHRDRLARRVVLGQGPQRAPDRAVDPGGHPAGQGQQEHEGDGRADRVGGPQRQRRQLRPRQADRRGQQRRQRQQRHDQLDGQVQAPEPPPTRAAPPPAPSPPRPAPAAASRGRA